MSLLNDEVMPEKTGPVFHAPEHSIHVFVVFAQPETRHQNIGIASPFMIRGMNLA